MAGAAPTALVRIKKEYKEVTNAGGAGASGVSATLVGDDFTHWKGQLAGPDGSPYEGGTFVVDILIPKNYPFEPPKMRFDTKVWHPNVSSANGAICLDILKNEWSPALTLRTALLSLQALLSTPNPDDPQDAQVAGQFKKDKKVFEGQAKAWTLQYATKAGGEAKVKKLAEMGFDPAKSRTALDKTGGDEAAAMEYLLSHA